MMSHDGSLVAFSDEEYPIFVSRWQNEGHSVVW